MHGGALNADIALVHEMLLTTIKDGNNGTLGDDAVVEGLGAVHDGVGSGAEFHIAEDGAAAEGEACVSLGHAVAAVDEGRVSCSTGTIVWEGKEVRRGRGKRLTAA